MGPPGHLGVGFAAKKIAPKVPLWALLVATWFLDILSILFIALGIETTSVTETTFKRGLVYHGIGNVAYSHGLFMSIVWSVVIGGIAYLFLKDGRSGLVMGGAVFSHWLIDFVVHGPDLPLFFENSPHLGLGLWTSGPGLIISGILEFVFLIGGIIIWWRWRKRRDEIQLAQPAAK